MSERAGTSARRRRKRRLRSWLRHERMTAAMELATATHHSSPKGGWPDATHNASRRHKSASSVGPRPAALREPVPHLLTEHAACPCFSGVPSQSLHVLADRVAKLWTPRPSGSSRLLLEKHIAVQEEAAEAMQRARLLLELAGKRRKRKKRRRGRSVFLGVLLRYLCAARSDSGYMLPRFVPLFLGAPCIWRFCFVRCHGAAW